MMQQKDQLLTLITEEIIEIRNDVRQVLDQDQATRRKIEDKIKEEIYVQYQIMDLKCVDFGN